MIALTAFTTLVIAVVLPDPSGSYSRNPTIPKQVLRDSTQTHPSLYPARPNLQTASGSLLAFGGELRYPSTTDKICPVWPGRTKKDPVMLEIRRRTSRKVWGIFWIDASSLENIECSFANIAILCGLTGDASRVKR